MQNPNFDRPKPTKKTKLRTTLTAEKAHYYYSERTKCLRPNSPGPLMDDWKVMDNSSVNFHDVFFFIFCQIIAKNEEKHVMEIYR